MFRGVGIVHAVHRLAAHFSLFDLAFESALVTGCIGVVGITVLGVTRFLTIGRDGTTIGCTLVPVVSRVTLPALGPDVNMADLTHVAAIITGGISGIGVAMRTIAVLSAVGAHGTTIGRTLVPVVSRVALPALGPGVSMLLCTGSQTVPANALVDPTSCNQIIAFNLAAGEVPGTNGNVGVVQAIHGALIVCCGVERNTFIGPALCAQLSYLTLVSSIQVIAGGGVEKAIHRDRRSFRNSKADTLVDPTGCNQVVTLGNTTGVEVFRGVGIVHAVHRLAACFALFDFAFESALVTGCIGVVGITVRSITRLFNMRSHRAAIASTCMPMVSHSVLPFRSPGVGMPGATQITGHVERIRVSMLCSRGKHHACSRHKTIHPFRNSIRMNGKGICYAILTHQNCRGPGAIVAQGSINPTQSFVLSGIDCPNCITHGT